MHVNSHTNTGVNIEPVQVIIAQTVKEITLEMVKALMSGLQEKLDFKGLAEKYISVKHKEEISESDEKIQMVYEKIFQASLEHIQKNSPPLVMTFAAINQQTGNPESAGMFLGTFVLNAVKSMVEKLKLEQPEVIEDKGIWGN